ncbi:hypothetical protein B484DRAFT_438867 [Ochromonadaceae sp. CCMP2298]|nr:hypothetical protein B484DRAFT_438867 [Ochromonadaceae sp. CCMP2298]
MNPAAEGETAMYKTLTKTTFAHIILEAEQTFVEVRDAVLQALAVELVKVDAKRGRLYCAQQKGSSNMFLLDGTDSLASKLATCRKQRRMDIHRFMEACWSDPRSPWHHAFVAYHKGVMGAYLVSLMFLNRTLLDQLLTDVDSGVFPRAEDFGQYNVDKSWSTATHVQKAQGCVFGLGKYPAHNGEIPTADRGKQMDKDRARTDAPPPAQKNEGFAVIAEAMDRRDTKAAKSALQLQEHEHAHQLQLATLNARNAGAASMAVQASSAGGDTTVSAQERKRILIKAEKKLTNTLKELKEMVNSCVSGTALDNANDRVLKRQIARNKAQALNDPSSDEEKGN